MKAKLFLFFILVSMAIQAQQTYEIDWKMGISQEDASVNGAPGDTVKWIWGEEGMPHDVSSTDPNAPEDFGSEIMTGMGSEYEYTFTEEVMFEYGCSVHSTMIGVITITSMSIEDTFIKNLKYYPNPSSDILYITSLMPVNGYKIFNIEGKEIAGSTFENSTAVTINTNNLHSGLYFVQVFSGDIFTMIKISIK